MSTSTLVIGCHNFAFPYVHPLFSELGAFKLDLAWHPLTRFLEKNFAWAGILAEKKNVKLDISSKGRPSLSEDNRQCMKMKS